MNGVLHLFFRIVPRAVRPAASRGPIAFWDINEMANKIIAVLRHPPLASTLRQHGAIEVGRMSCTDAAKGCIDVYQQAIAGMG